MRAANVLTLALTIVGGFNWGLVAWFGEDLVGFLLGRFSIAARLTYLAFAFAAAWQLLPLWLSFRIGEQEVQANRLTGPAQP